MCTFWCVCACYHCQKFQNLINLPLFGFYYRGKQPKSVTSKNGKVINQNNCMYLLQTILLRAKHSKYLAICPSIYSPYLNCVLHVLTWVSWPVQSYTVIVIIEFCWCEGHNPVYIMIHGHLAHLQLDNSDKILQWITPYCICGSIITINQLIPCCNIDTTRSSAVSLGEWPFGVLMKQIEFLLNIWCNDPAEKPVVAPWQRAIRISIGYRSFAYYRYSASWVLNSCQNRNWITFSKPSDYLHIPIVNSIK